MKIFGKELFAKKLVEQMYDFAQHGLLDMPINYGDEWINQVAIVTTAEEADEVAKKKRKAKKTVKKEEKIEITPKGLYALGTLNIKSFAINCDPAYIDEQVSILEKKLAIIGPKPSPKKRGRAKYIDELVYEDGAVQYGRKEVESMVERLNNRRFFKGFNDTESNYGFSEWPYTTNDAIRELLANHKHLEAKPVLPSLPDLPGEAVDAMQKYIELTKHLCNKRPVFYLILEKKKNEVARRRDPILLAQSPFGMFWQVLGAWDEEVKFLDEI